MLGVSIRPTDLFYVTAGASNAYSQTLRAEIDSLFSRWNIFAFGEVGFTPPSKGLAKAGILSGCGTWTHGQTWVCLKTME